MDFIDHYNVKMRELHGKTPPAIDSHTRILLQLMQAERDYLHTVVDMFREMRETVEKLKKEVSGLKWSGKEPE